MDQENSRPSSEPEETSNLNEPEVQIESIISVEPEQQNFDGRRSKVFKEFLKLDPRDTKDGKERALYKHYKTASFLSDSHYGTTNMRKHLDRCHHFQKESSIKNGEPKIFDQKEYRELVSRAIIKHGYAFSWVEHEGNREIHAYLNHQVRSICRNTAKADCLKMHAKYKDRLKDTLRRIPGRVCLTCDMWTSCQTEGYMCLTGHYVDSNWKLNSRVLNFCHIDSPHTGKTMYNVVLNLIQEWGIDDKIFSITLDNASSNDKMQDYLKATLKGRRALLYNGDFLHVRCAAHVLNLIVKDGLKVIDHVVVKIRDCVKYIKWSESRKNTFRYCVKLAKIKETKALWLDVPTRWNSTYMMLDRAILYREAMVEMTELRSCPSLEEWEMLEKIRDVLEPFYEITELFSGSDYPTSNLYFGNVWKILMLLNELSQTNEGVLKTMGIEMLNKFNKYWFNSEDDDYGMLFSFAFILDPRCKLSVLKFCYEQLYGDQVAALKISEARLKLERFYKEYDLDNDCNERHGNTASTRNTPSVNYKRKYDYFAQYDNQETLTSSIGRSKLDIYLEDPKMERKVDLDILAFWKENEQRYGALSYLARDILTVPLTTVASESTFSIGGRILNKWRSSYLPENVEALITTRSWLFGYESNEDEEFVGCYVDWATTKS